MKGKKDSALGRIVAQNRKKYKEVTVDQVKKLLPRGSAVQVSENIVNKINNVEDRTGIGQEDYNQDLLTHINVLQEGSWSLEQLDNALQYVTLKRYGLNNTQSWSIVKPDEYKRQMELYEAAKEAGDEAKMKTLNVHAHSSAFNRSPIVVELETRMAIPMHIAKMGVVDEAWGVLEGLMHGKVAPGDDGKPIYVSPTVRKDAAIAIIEKGTLPPELKVDMKMGLSDEAMEAQVNMTDQLKAMAEVQRKNFESGAKLDSVQRLNVKYIEAEVVEDDD